MVQTVCVLQVGSTVEVKTNEGLSSEAVISKLTDASLYTVGELLPADWSTHAAASCSDGRVNSDPEDTTRLFRTPVFFSSDGNVRLTTAVHH